MVWILFLIIRVEILFNFQYCTFHQIVLTIDRQRKLRTWEVIQFNLHLKYQKVFFISF